jgi:hypothetical protein
MAIGVSVLLPNRNQWTVQVDHFPDSCPICHSAGMPTLVGGAARSDPPTAPGHPHILWIDLAFQCPRIRCRKLFVGEYHVQTVGGTFYLLSDVAPVTTKPVTFSQEITKVSPTFALIYNQAMAAEGAKLDQLTGIGLRKALEFLVKDFAKSRAPDDKAKAEIERSQLGQCIEKHIADAQVQRVAKRAAWLGNDETHYVRKWEDKDITDLKNLLSLTRNAIDNVLLADHYEKEMP